MHASRVAQLNPLPESLPLLTVDSGRGEEGVAVQRVPQTAPVAELQDQPHLQHSVTPSARRSVTHQDAASHEPAPLPHEHARARGSGVWGRTYTAETGTGCQQARREATQLPEGRDAANPADAAYPFLQGHARTAQRVHRPRADPRPPPRSRARPARSCWSRAPGSWGRQSPWSRPARWCRRCCPCRSRCRRWPLRRWRHRTPPRTRS